MKSTDISSKLTFWSINLTLLSVPLVFFPGANLIFEIPKVAVFRSLVLLAWLGVALSGLSALAPRERRGSGGVAIFFEKRIFWFIGVWMGVLALAVGFSIAPWTSFWGSYFRQQGLLQMIFYLMFFGAIVVGEREARIRRAIEWLCAGAFLASVAAIAHYFFEGIYRAFGTMGHPNFLGAYLVMCMPFCVWLFKDGARGGGWRGWKWWRWIWLGGILVNFAAIFLTFSKAAVLGVLIAGLVWVWFSGRKRLFVILASVGVCGIVAITGMFFMNPTGGEPAGKGGLGELSSESYKSASDRLLMKGDSLKSAEVRFDIWEDAISKIVERPLLGIGPDTFGRTYAQAESIGFGGVPDRAHNEILDTLLGSGILGLFAYLSLLFYVFLVCYRRRSDPLVVACAASLAGLFAANMFGFSTTVHHMIWWAILGIVVVKNGERKELNFSIPRGRLVIAIGTVLAVIVAAGLIFNFGFRVLYADYLYSRGVEKVFEFKQEEAKEYFEKAAEYNPAEEYYRSGEREAEN